MIDRANRDIAARVLRDFAEGLSTNDDFERQFPRQSDDPGLAAIKANVWALYSDLHQHRLTGVHTPTRPVKALLERCVLFLESDVAFEWPVPTIRLSNLTDALVSRVRRAFTRSTRGEDPQTSAGDEDVWPFFRSDDYDACATRVRDGH